MDAHLVDKRLAWIEAACDPAIVRAVLVTNLCDFGAFVQSIRARLAELRG